MARLDRMVVARLRLHVCLFELLYKLVDQFGAWRRRRYAQQISMDDLSVVARVKPLVVLGGEYDEPIFHEYIAVPPIGVAMADTQQLWCASGLAGGNMD
ncbi:hypothetical protein N7474_010272 [Penicillium riverlandense]|uniref:uncharacterized protein n=1 Tax=Penicillium riverlandense TaxID=1903569 RepID=UPI002547140C|nr:uncharacterized protein N7474_010272 [Penicillium riverlandense]KAJ5809003.1 hypothetical protein N7474_010272 [Penicillium riverlandense]